MFATVFFGILDLPTGILYYANCGHLPPVLVKKHQPQIVLERTGPALGAIPDADYKIEETRLEPGDLMFAYTDGLTDTENPNGEFFDKTQLGSILAQQYHPLSALLDEIFASAEAHAAGAKQLDDITVLTVRKA